MAKSSRKCGACTPATLIRQEFAAAKKESVRTNSCEPMERVLEKLKPVVQLEADRNPKKRNLLFREILSKSSQTQKLCTKIKGSSSYWAGFEGVRSSRRRPKRRRAR